MNEQIWYVYHNEQQVGPFMLAQLQQLITNKMIAQNAYIFKVGWKDWRPMEDCYEEMDLPSTAPPSSDERREKAPRASIQGRVVVHNNGQLAIGAGVNISSSGIFVETKEELFHIREHLKLSVRCAGMKKAFNVVAKVMRYNQNPKYPIGYGLQFQDLDESVRNEIDRIVREHNASLAALAS
jgi:hypothetical protein